VSWSSRMGKRKQSDRHPPSPPAPSRAGQPPCFLPDEFSVAAYREGRSWLDTTAVSLQRAHLSGNRPPCRVGPAPGNKLPLGLHRPYFHRSTLAGSIWQRAFYATTTAGNRQEYGVFVRRVAPTHSVVRSALCGIGIRRSATNDRSDLL
jgi:hypothetical protein